MDENHNKLKAEIAELQALIREAEQRQDDPEAEIAACLFRQLLRRRESRLVSLSQS